MKNQLFTFVLFVFFRTAFAADVTIYVDNTGPAAFAAAEISAALIRNGHEVQFGELQKLGDQKAGVQIVLSDVSKVETADQWRRAKAAPATNLQPEGFSLRTTRRRQLTTHWVIGAVLEAETAQKNSAQIKRTIEETRPF